ncbi:MAG: hypothetical protein ABIO17_12255 [Pseudoxanthomonas sp.]
MAATHAPQTKSPWLSWFAAPAQPNGWRVVRFAQVDADGMPIGKPVPSLSPAGQERTFVSEASAGRAAGWLNLQAEQ